MVDLSHVYDVLVVGGGVAGLSAALVARQAGASVLVLEQAAKEFRGGNSRHARNMRVAHDAPTRYVRGTYPASDYWDEIARATHGNTDERLARIMIDESAQVTPWMQACGVRFQPWDARSLRPSRRTVYLLGGGKALLNTYYRTARQLGIDVVYAADVVALDLRGAAVLSAEVLAGGAAATVRAKAVVLAAGGIQSSVSWLKQSWGEAADNLVIRGPAYANDKLLHDLFAQDVAAIGSPSQCHCVAVDARSPRFDGGLVTRLEGLPFGIIVNSDGRRFDDEGRIVGPERYATWGSLVARQPGQCAYFLFDAKVRGLFRPSIYPPIRADTVAELAARLGVDPARLMATVADFNHAVRAPSGRSARAGLRTEHLDPPKSRWAAPLDAPPFEAYPVRAGVTFSYFGVKVDARARVLLHDGRPVDNVFAAGLIMAANILGQGYLAGMGLTIATTFGRIAGRHAASVAGRRGETTST